MTFDTQRRALVKGERVLAQFSEVDHVELRETPTKNHRFWRVCVRLSNSRRIDLGVQASQIDADLAAAHVATVVGKPVRYVIR